MGQTRTMSDNHKAALAAGRVEGARVRRYLETLEANSGRSSRSAEHTPENLEAKIAELRAAIDNPEISAIQRLQKIQERIDFEDQLAKLGEQEDDGDIDRITDEFVEIALAYSQRKGISYLAWRTVGVPAAVLSRANINRSFKVAA